jgi:flavin reductase (DIM6/NTAB) family NADH-FMN oxidoreductase RutF
MASFSTADRPAGELYKYLIGAVAPRPIAFVSTRSREGLVNLSPFSFFNAITGNPPILAFSVIDRGGEMKDTSRNISEHPEFVVHIVSEPIAEQMNVTCGDYGADIDEFREAGLTAVPGTAVDVPRVAEAMVAFECRLLHHLRLGRPPTQVSHIIGEVVHWHLDDRILEPGARNPIRLDVLRPVGRMGAVDYCRTGDRFSMERPVIAPEDPRSIAARKAALGAAAARPPLPGK